ncbi:replication/maintenance protein RepL [Bacillus cereus]
MANKDWNELLDLNLNGDKKIQVLNFVMDNLNNENQLHMTQKEISEKTGVSSRTIAETMKALQESEFFNKVQSGIYQVNPKFEHNEEIRKPQGLEIDTKKINESLENLTLKNLINESIHEVQETLEKDIDNPDTPNLTKDDIKNLLEQHLKNIEDALDKYNDQKGKGVTWKERINTFKGSLQKSFNNFKESLKQKARSVRDAPINLKNYVKNKLIDGVVKINNKIINKTNAINQKIVNKTNAINEKMEQARPNKSPDNVKEAQQNSQHDDQIKVQKPPVNQLDEFSIVDYKTEYKKHLMDNFKGQTESDINKASIHTIDSHLVAKPHLAIALRQEAISELRKETISSNDKNLNVQNFNSYLNDKSDLLAHATKYFEPLQQNQLLEEDLKFEPYKEPEKSINTLYKEVKEADSKLLDALGDYKVGDQFFPKANNLEIVQLYMDRNEKLEAYEEKSGEKYTTFRETDQEKFERYKNYLREEIKTNDTFKVYNNIPENVQSELDKELREGLKKLDWKEQGLTLYNTNNGQRSDEFIKNLPEKLTYNEIEDLYEKGYMLEKKPQDIYIGLDLKDVKEEMYKAPTETTVEKEELEEIER